MAHRPTWDPAAGKADNRHNSRLYSVRQMPAHTKLKFRAPSQQALPEGLNVRDIQSGADVAGRRDLKRELERAERTARNKRRKEQGLKEEPEPEEQGEADQRRLAIEEAAAAQLDRDDDSSDDEGAMGKGKARAVDIDDAPVAGADASDSSDSDDDEEDDTAALLRELEKIKRERAEEKARNEAERSAVEQSQREDDIALGNPLLNLENAMKGGPGAASAKQKLDFGVKRRWDDDVIFKNQAAGNEGSGEKGFVNDLTRSEFHKKFLNRYIK